MRLIRKRGEIAYMAILFLLFIFLCTFTAYAANGPIVVENFTGEKEVVLYLKGIQENLTDVSVQVGTTACESVTQSKLAETGQPVKTLIMLDNSLSIQKADRKHISKLIQTIISDRMENEKMALAVFNKGLVYLADYTADESALSKATGGITYQKSNTYLTDVLYDLLATEYVQAADDEFYRIIVISDGMDNKSIGYTKGELFDLLKEHPVPIYTIGLRTAKKDNNEELKNMFAISRLTGVESFLLNGRNGSQDIIQAIHEDRDIVRLAVQLPDELMDGSKKTVKLSFVSGKDISTAVVMPQTVKVTDTKDTNLRKEAAVKEEPDGKYFAIAGIPPMILILISLLMLAAVVSVAVIVIKRKNGTRSHEDYNSFEQNKTDRAEIEQTEMMPETEEGITETEMEESAESAYHIILTDIQSPVRSFQVPLRSSVIIGRTRGECGIVIDYDKSVSSRHCKIELRNDKFYVTDLDSLNGTSVDGHKITSETEIFSGNTLKMGRLTCRFEVVFGQEE